MHGAADGSFVGDDALDVLRLSLVAPGFQQAQGGRPLGLDHVRFAQVLREQVQVQLVLALYEVLYIYQSHIALSYLIPLPLCIAE